MDPIAAKQDLIHNDPLDASAIDRFDRDVDDDPGAREDAVKVCMPAGSVMIANGGLWHRGGANRTTTARLIVTPQYCAGWARPLENMILATPSDMVRRLPERLRQLIGYSIHPPFTGYVDGMHPARTLDR